MLKGVLAATTAAAIWGGMYVVSKVVLEVFPPITLVVVRFCVALPVLLVWHWLVEARRGRPLTRGMFATVAAAGFVGFCVSLIAQFAGTRLSTASMGAVITSAVPAFVVPCAYVLLREKPSAQQLVGLAIATLGVVIVVNPFQPGETERGAAQLVGNVLLVVAALSWALYSVMVKRATQRGVSALTATLCVTAWGIAFDAPLAALELRANGVGVVTTEVVLGVLYLGVVSTAVAFFLWNKGFELLDANTAALCFFAQPIVGALLGSLLLNESPGLGFVVGGVVIGAGVLIGQLKLRRAPAVA